MLELSNPVSAIKNIGPKYKVMLENLEIFTVGDLLYHFPFRYDDFSVVKKISELQPQETATAQGTLGEVKNIFTRYGKRITRTQLTDETGVINIIWFNSHYLKKSLNEGETYNISGKVSLFDKKPCFIAPSFEETESNNVNTGRLVPIYPETAGVSSKWLRTKIHDVLTEDFSIKEFLPESILKREELPEINRALRAFHFPSNLEEAGQAKRRFQYEELILELLNVEKRKNAWAEKLKSINLEYDNYKNEVSQLISNLPFKLTSSQEKAVDEIINDLQKPHPMNRLLEGDVGTGKTIVSLIAAYLANLNGKNVLYMAPTEILAKQHFDTYKKYLDKLGLYVYLLTAFTPKKSQEFKQPYIAIGTHALLFQEKYTDIGLVIVDEQHRFGVEQRTKLINLNDGNYTPHLLTMTATPIPRTLALTLYGDLEISQIHHIPGRERQVKTVVVPEKQRDKTLQWVAAKNEQTFLVCPFIEQSGHEDFVDVKAATKEYETLKKGVFKKLKLGLLHGKMKAVEKKEAVEQFEQGKVQVLVSTPVIEVGIDIPQASIMVIESAERYGLASLHQLRGRVGRGEKPGFCFMIMGGNNRSAYRRLKYLEEINEGIKLAEIDLKIRGQGDIYGIMQHGFKRLKVASLSDLEMLEKAKKYASALFLILDELPLLQHKLYEKSGRWVGNN